MSSLGALWYLLMTHEKPTRGPVVLAPTLCCRCATVWIATGASSLTEKYLAMVLPVSAFVAFGAEHSVSEPLGSTWNRYTTGVCWANVQLESGAMESLMRWCIGLQLLEVEVDKYEAGVVVSPSLTLLSFDIPSP